MRLAAAAEAPEIPDPPAGRTGNLPITTRRFDGFRIMAQKRKSPAMDCGAFVMARPEGVEPPTFWFVARRSIQLSYGRVFGSVFPTEGAALYRRFRDGSRP